MKIIETSPWSRTTTRADLKGPDVRWVKPVRWVRIDPLAIIGAMLIAATAGQALIAVFCGG